MVHRPTVLNPLPNSIVALVGDATFKFIIPNDTFVDQEDGFALNITVQFPDGLPAWLRFDDKQLLFSGVPTMKNLGVTPIFAFATDKTNLTSEPTFMTVVVTPDIRIPPLLEFNIDFTYVNTSSGGSSGGRRRLLQSGGCSVAEVTAADRVDLSNRLAAFENVSVSEINIITIEPSQSNPCINTVVFSENNNNLDCTQAASSRQSFQQRADSGELQRALGPRYNVTSASTVQRSCNVVVLPRAGESHADDKEYVSSVVPIVLFACLLTLAVCLALYVYRRMAHKKERGINETFLPKAPTILDTDRNMAVSEYDRAVPAILDTEPWLYESGTPDFEFDSFFAAPKYEEAEQRYDLYESLPAPQYRAPPAYPFESRELPNTFLGKHG